ncbi:MAG: hypothetical protein QM781_09960 [Chitinophagaceae bacterium]
MYRSVCLKAFLLILLLAGGMLLQAQKNTFPDSWQGSWKGTLAWYRPGTETPQLVPMQLRIAKADTGYSWQLTYGEQTADYRPYRLLARDSARGHWVIDERNGIVLDQFWTAGRLSGAFTVQTSTLVNSYYLQGDSLVVEFYSIAAVPINTSGEGTASSPRVDSYRLQGYQKAVLRRDP